MNKNRSTIIAGNWKMNKNREETARLLAEMESMLPEGDVKVLLCIPAINIPVARRTLKTDRIILGAENCHWAKSGAFTGEISADMLKSYDITYSIVGHSERRQYFGETDETVNRRALTCLESGIHPVICVGENLEQREAGISKDIIKGQIVKGLASFTEKDILETVIAYEPVWAIGTGKTATDRQAEEICGFIRLLLADMFGRETARKIPILYGGSMNAANADGLLSMENIDGGLIGGASLKAGDFTKIVEYRIRRL